MSEQSFACRGGGHPSRGQRGPHAELSFTSQSWGEIGQWSTGEATLGKRCVFGVPKGGFCVQKHVLPLPLCPSHTPDYFKSGKFKIIPNLILTIPETERYPTKKTNTSPHTIMGAAFSAGAMTRSWSGPCWICVRMPWALYLWRCVVKHSTAPRGIWSLSPCPWIHVVHCALLHASVYIWSHPTWCLIGFCISLALKICKYLSHLTLKPFGLDEMLHVFTT